MLKSNMDKTSVAVLMGGKSPEHDVSLLTGKGIVENLDKQKYHVIPVIISKDGLNWKIKTIDEFLKLDLKIDKQAAERQNKKPTFSKFSIPVQPDIFFIAMHGPFGEDGTIQGMLDFVGAQYTGSGVSASAIGMNKIIFKKIIEQQNIPQPNWQILTKNKSIKTKKIDKIGPPWVVKPSNQGSSIGVSIVENRKGFSKAAKEAFKYSPKIIIEEYIQGTEVSCGIIGNKSPQLLPIIEIRPKNDFFDYESKYTVNMCEEIVPAEISKKAAKKVEDLALKVYQAINCQDFGRVDMIIKKGQPYVLEINTIPGLTPTSLLPQEAAAADISYPQLLDKIITSALNRF